MSLILSDLGAGELLRRALNNDFPVGGQDLTLHLYINDHTPQDTDTAATYSEASGGGYAAKPLTTGDWSIYNDAGIMAAAFAQQIFEFTGPLDLDATIYGYFVTDSAGTLLWAERAPAVFTPAVLGDIMRVTPEIQLSKGTPS